MEFKDPFNLQLLPEKVYREEKGKTYGRRVLGRRCSGGGANWYESTTEKRVERKGQEYQCGIPIRIWYRQKALWKN
jgi:hypothetical protein